MQQTIQDKFNKLYERFPEIKEKNANLNTFQGQAKAIYDSAKNCIALNKRPVSKDAIISELEKICDILECIAEKMEEHSGKKISSYCQNFIKNSIADEKKVDERTSELMQKALGLEFRFDLQENSQIRRYIIPTVLGAFLMWMRTNPQTAGEVFQNCFAIPLFCVVLANMVNPFLNKATKHFAESYENFMNQRETEQGDNRFL